MQYLTAILPLLAATTVDAQRQGFGAMKAVTTTSSVKVIPTTSSKGALTSSSSVVAGRAGFGFKPVTTSSAPYANVTTTKTILGTTNLSKSSSKATSTKISTSSPAPAPSSTKPTTTSSIAHTSSTAKSTTSSTPSSSSAVTKTSTLATSKPSSSSSISTSTTKTLTPTTSSTVKFSSTSSKLTTSTTSSTIKTTSSTTSSSKTTTSSPLTTSKKSSTMSTSTLQKTTTTSSAAACTSTLPVYGCLPLTNQAVFVQHMLDQHNTYRMRHNAANLTWSTDLVPTALANAQNNADNNVFVHTSNNPYGENIAYQYGYNNPEYLGFLWYDEEKKYNFTTGGFSEATGHFTQLVWLSSSQLGCAYVQAHNSLGNNGWYYLSCEYNTPGNYYGEYQQEVKAPNSQAYPTQPPQFL